MPVYHNMVVLARRVDTSRNYFDLVRANMAKMSFTSVGSEVDSWTQQPASIDIGTCPRYTRADASPRVRRLSQITEAGRRWLAQVASEDT
jgi:hypothetical protein